MIKCCQTTWNSTKSYSFILFLKNSNLQRRTTTAFTLKYEWSDCFLSIQMSSRFREEWIFWLEVGMEVIWGPLQSRGGRRYYHKSHVYLGMGGQSQEPFTLKYIVRWDLCFKKRKGLKTLPSFSLLQWPRLRLRVSKEENLQIWGHKPVDCELKAAQRCTFFLCYFFLF